MSENLQETPPPKDMRFLAGIRTCVKVWEATVWKSKKMLRRTAAQEKNEYRAAYDITKKMAM